MAQKIDGVCNRKAWSWGRGRGDKPAIGAVCHFGKRNKALAATDHLHTVKGWVLSEFTAFSRTYLCLNLLIWLRSRAAISTEWGSCFLPEFLAPGTSDLRAPEAPTYQFDRYIFIGVEIFACEGKRKIF